LKSGPFEGPVGPFLQPRVSSSTGNAAVRRKSIFFNGLNYQLWRETVHRPYTSKVSMSLFIIVSLHFHSFSTFFDIFFI